MGNIFLVSTLAGLATGIGGLLACLIKKPQTSIVSLLLGFAAGVMIAVTGFDLIPAALMLGGGYRTALGFIAGLAVLWILDVLIPHYADQGDGQGYPPAKWRKIGLFIVTGIALHNLPEGLAIGAGYFAAEGLGVMIAIAIALHNVPEGMAAALPLRLGGMPWWKILFLTCMAGFFTPIGTYIGSLLYGISGQFICLSLSFAGGAMIYIVSNELLPSSNRYHPFLGRLGMVGGVALIILLSRL